LYKCQVCGRQFREGAKPDNDDLWTLYQARKQTIDELASHYGVSSSTIKRRLRNIHKGWQQPELTGSGFVHIDATYWGRNWGILLAIDELTGKPLYLSFIKHETNADYRTAIKSIEARGYKIKGIVIDGKQSLFDVFAEYNVQMCQFHMCQIARRYLTKNPRMRAAKELKTLMGTLTQSSAAEFQSAYETWQKEFADFINKRTISKLTGKSHFTHKRLRTLKNSIDFYLPYLFTYQKDECRGMSNTNNKIEGTFTDLKKNLNNHSGMSEENRKRFINGFFLASTT